ncbi:NAD(P)H-hydrate epimerase [Candidatus Omnitrophota bacterium]
MKAATSEQIQKLDHQTINEYDINSLWLMENAGTAVATIVEQFLNRRARKSSVIVCGKGNNGGDGFVVARKLLQKGFQVSVFLLGEKSAVTHDAGLNLAQLEKRSCTVEEVVGKPSLEKMRQRIVECDVVVDAIFGVGLKGEIKEPARTILETIVQAAKPIIAVDVPSGLDATTGEMLGICVKAIATVTFSLPKTGFFQRLGPSCIGELYVVDIGIPKELIEAMI